MIGMGIAIAIAVVLLIVGFAAGYFVYPAVNKSSNNSGGTPSLSETGSSLFYPLMTRWAANYSAATISAASTGSGTGQSSAILNIVNMGASDGYLSNATVSGVTNFAAAISAQYVFYNIPNVNAHLNLNATILALIYNGTITTWNNPMIVAANPGVSLPSNTIVPYARSDSSGDTFLFSTYCAMGDKFWPFGVSTKALINDPHATGADLNSGMVSAVTGTKYSIAYVGISYSQSAISGGAQYAALGTNASMTATGGTTVTNYILPTPATIDQDANLGLTHLNYPVYGLAVTLIMGGSPAGAINITNGAGGTNPTTQYPTPYPIVNLEYLIIKLAPVSGTVVSSSNLAATVAFLQWTISTGNYAAGSTPSTWLTQVGFLPITPEVGGYDTQILASVHT